MRYTTATALLVAAMSASDAMAGPAHAHLHQRAHQKRELDWKNIDYTKVDFSKLDVDWAKAYAKGQAEKGATGTKVAAADLKNSLFAAKASPSPKAKDDKKDDKHDDDSDDEDEDHKGKNSSKPPKPSATPKPSSDIVGELFNGVVGLSNNRKTFGAKSTEFYALGDFAVNNVGSPYGSNMIKVDKIGDYPFTATFVNPQKKPITINVWNKVGESNGGDNVFSGSTDAPKKTCLTFVVPPGGEQVIAVDENSNIGWVEATSKLRKDSGGFDTSFGEATFLEKGSGYDLSAIPNTDGNKYNMSISSKEVKCISDMTQNYWLTATQPIGSSDGSCYIPNKTATLKVVMAGNV